MLINNKYNDEKTYIVRCHDASAFFGQLTDVNGREVSLKNARRIWYWDGAQSLSDMAANGVTRPQNCKFPAPVTVTVLDACEIIECTEKAEKILYAVPIWTAKGNM